VSLESLESLESNEPDGGVRSRQAAFADLVSALLDLRSPEPTRSFDQAVTDAIQRGELTDALGRQLKWLQRESVRGVVEHAAQVLPAILMALEGADLSVPESPAQTPATDPPEVDAEVPASPVDLTARRLLVAGLRPIDDPPFP
jgi:hypothetical protein